jgi:hypothetical protein
MAGGKGQMASQHAGLKEEVEGLEGWGSGRVEIMQCFYLI